MSALVVSTSMAKALSTPESTCKMHHYWLRQKTHTSGRQPVQQATFSWIGMT